VSLHHPVCGEFLYLISLIECVFFFFLIVSRPYVALTRPVLAPVWRDRVLRAQRLTNRPHTYYIQPELLFRHSFGPEPSAAVISLLETNKKSKGGFHCLFCFCCFLSLCLFMCFAGVATMKINKSKLKDMVEKGVPAMPINVKRKKPEDGSSSAPPAQGVSSV
jgi:hypothetical protein